jgi:hypothetical protein
MDIILGMLGIALLWLLGSCFSMIGIGLVLTFYSKIKKIPMEELNDYKTYIKYAYIIGAIFVLAVLAKRGGFL